MENSKTALQKITIYVLELEHGCYYVGSTTNLARRLRQHQTSTREKPHNRVPEWEKHHPFKRLHHSREHTVHNITEAHYLENKYTLRAMQLFGENNVRGGSYHFVNQHIHQAQLHDPDRFARLIDNMEKTRRKRNRISQCGPTNGIENAIAIQYN